MDNQMGNMPQGNMMPGNNMGNMSNMGGGEKSHKNIIIGLILVIILAGVFFYMQRPASRDTGEVENAAAAIASDVMPGEVEVVGSLACTPLVNGEALQEGECVMGLMGDDGMFYALDTMGLEIVEDTNLDGKVRVVGGYSPKADSEETGMYDYEGVIKVRSLKGANAQ